jgi:site-specific DNA-cytosine methylase
MLNFPDTIQLGDVRNIDARTLGHIDLLMGGSPCQSFSFAGKRAGMSTKQNEEIYTLERYLELKQAGFEFEGQSYLFWEYVRILQELRESNPDVYFLLENVEMGKKWEKVLSEAIGLQGVHINSALVSAQIRKCIYWTIDVIAHILSFLQLKAQKHIEKAEEPKPKKCGNCALCIHTYMGSEYSLTDNAVDDAQDSCTDYIPED